MCDREVFGLGGCESTKTTDFTIIKFIKNPLDARSTKPIKVVELGDKYVQ